MEYRALRSDISRNGPKFYYAGEPGPKLDRLAKMLFEMDENSVLWYGKPEGDYVLGRMDGVFLPVTCALLTKDGPVMAEYVPFALKNGIPMGKSIVFSSGRISQDYLEKVIKAGFRIVVSRAAVTASAVALARKENITMLGFIRRNGGNIYHVGDVSIY